jgi:ADP-ribose pyrophosphatase
MKLLASTEHYRNALMALTVDEVLDPRGNRITRAVVQHPGSAVVLPVDSRGRIILVRQFRWPARRYLWELPAGKLDEGEKPLAAAKRELKEETGFTARRWTRIVTFFPSPGFLAEKMTIYLAEQLQTGKAEPTDDEQIEWRWFARREIEQGIRRGRIADGKTMIGLLALDLHRKQ